MSRGMSFGDKLGVVIGSIGTIASGCFMAFAPIESMRAEMPYYFEVGLGVIIFGILLFLALFIVRIKSLMVFFSCAVLAVGLGFAAYGAGPSTWEFYVFGGVALLMGIFSMICLVAVFTGDDPVGEP